MPQGLLRGIGAWAVDKRLITSGAAPTAALDRTKTSLLMPCAEDATPGLQSLSAVARAAARPHGRRRAAWAGSRT